LSDVLVFHSSVTVGTELAQKLTEVLDDAEFVVLLSALSSEIDAFLDE
jgi:hypothetical protein